MLYGVMILALAAASVIASTRSWHRNGESVAGEKHSGETLRTVTVVQPTRATTGNTVLPATFRPWQTTTLHARVNGYLAAWHFDLGDRVHTDDLLAEIETPELDQELSAGQALAQEAEAAAVQARAERIEAEENLKVAQAQLDRARAEAELARSQLVRREKLLAKRVIVQEEYDMARKDVEARRADVAAMEADVLRQTANLETRSAVIAVREATVQSRRANVERLKELQVFKRITAPFDGVITRRAAEVGMLVTAGQESLFTLEDMSRIRVQVNVPQSYAPQIANGAVATIHLPDSTTRNVPAVITRITNSIDSASRTMLVEIELENHLRRFQPGSYAQVTLTMPQDQSEWTIPTNTLLMRVNGPHVALVNDDDRVELKPVSLGRDLGARVVVMDGIRGEERLIVNPADDLTNGVSIRIGNRDETAHKVAQR